MLERYCIPGTLNLEEGILESLPIPCGCLSYLNSDKCPKIDKQMGGFTKS